MMPIRAMDSPLGRGDRWRRGVKVAFVWSDGVGVGMLLKVDTQSIEANRQLLTAEQRGRMYRAAGGRIERRG